MRNIVLAMAMGSILAGCASVPPELATKRVDALKANSVDYSVFAQRRAKLLQAETQGSRRALADGFASARDLEQNGAGDPVPDPALSKRVAEQVRLLLPEGIEAPTVSVIVTDDLQIFGSRAERQLRTREGIRRLSTELKEQYKAFATETAGIIVPLSTLAATKSMDELNFLLGHEVSHILYDHFRDRERRQNIDTALQAATIVTAIAAGDTDTGQTVMGSLQALRLVNVLAAPAWERRQEHEADQLGLELLMDAGFSFDGATIVLDRLINHAESRERFLIELCGKKRSFGEKLLGGVLQEMIGQGIPQEGLQPNHPLCRQRNQLFADWNKTHPDPRERKALLKEYRARWYGEEALRNVQNFKDENGNVVDNFIAFASPNGPAHQLVQARDGIEAFKAGNIPRARAISRRIKTKVGGERLVQPLYLKFLVANYDGRRRRALAYLDEATKANRVDDKIFYILADEYAADGRYADAVDTLESREMRFKKVMRDYPIRIRYLRKGGRMARMQEELEKCRAEAPPGVAAECERAAQPEPETAPAPAPESETEDSPEAEDPGAAGTGPVSATPQVKTFVAAIKATGLNHLLTAEGQHTLFVPSDAAFAALPEDERKRLFAPENRAELKRLVRRHIVPKKAMVDIKDEISRAQSLSGEALEWSNELEPLLRGGTRFEVLNIEARNGVIHIIDRVIMAEEKNQGRKGAE